MDGDQTCTHQLSRAELYERVWSTPMRTLAAEFGISDVGLSKLCHRHQVPTPPRGYWAMKQNGRELPRPRLPHADTAASETVVIQGSPRKAESTMPDSARFEIVVSDELVDPHPLVERTVSSLRAAAPKADGRVTPRAKTALPVTVGPASIDRAGRILDALVKGLEARGHCIEVTGPEHARKIVVVVAGEEIGIAFGEKVEQERCDPTPTRNRTPTPDPWVYREREQYRQFPSGRLFLRIDSYCFGLRTQWTDGRRQRVEKRLGAFVTQLETLAVRIEKQREEREEAERRRQIWERERAEKLRLIHEEEERIKSLHAEADVWHRSQHLRRYIEAVRAAAIAERGAIERGSELDRWLAWASEQADRIDPLVESPPSILDEKRKYAPGYYVPESVGS